MRPRVVVIPLFAAALALAPSATPAGAATHTAKVKVTVLGRSGKKVSSTVDLVNVANGKQYSVTAGRTKSVPTGTYVIGSYIQEGKKLTLAARTVHVDGSTSLTFDARDGKRITGAVNQKNARLKRVTATLYVHTSGGDMPLDMEEPDPLAHPTVYAIPASGGKVRMSVALTLTDATISPSPYRFDLARTTKGIPHDLHFTAKKADLARVNLDLHTVDPDLKRWVDLAPNTEAGGLGMLAGGFGGATTPVGLPAPEHLVSYRSPGLTWRTIYDMKGHGRNAEVFQFMRGGLAKPTIYRAGRSYAETWGSGVWGVDAQTLGFITEGTTLYAQSFWPLCAPQPAGELSDICMSDATSSFKLFQGATQLAEGSLIEATIPTTPAWYDLQLDGSRPAGATTSSAFSARWHVRAGGGSADEPADVERGLITLAAAGLNGHNAAAHGSTTPVTMSVDGFDATSSADLAYSTDGTNWHAVTLTKSGANWVGTVPNPATAGGVSLRANAAGASGSTVSETITNAWAVD
jgi:hypothetical protein